MSAGLNLFDLIKKILFLNYSESLSKGKGILILISWDDLYIYTRCFLIGVNFPFLEIFRKELFIIP